MIPAVRSPISIAIRGTTTMSTRFWRHAEYGESVASMRDLAEACRQHKQLMFRAPDHGYERAEPGSYRLMPTEEMRKKLEVDYGRMSAMIIWHAPNVRRRDG